MKNTLAEKSFDFAKNLFVYCRKLQTQKKEFIISKQLIRSGTSIGANISEAQFAVSRADFSNKMSIALKECNETDFWIRLLENTIDNSQELLDLQKQNIELRKMLCKTVATSKQK